MWQILTDNRLKLLLFTLVLLPFCGFSQTAESSFHLASNHYIHKRLPEARATVDEALKKYPNDQKLNALKNKLKEEEKQDQQNKDQQDQQQQNKDQKDKENKDDKQKQENKDQQQKNEEEQKKKEQEQKDKEQKEKDQKERKPEEQDKDKEEQEKNQPQNLDRQKLQEMKISEEKAKMILEAMRNQEKQYLQQQKRKATKSRDRGKPDW